MRRVVLKVMAAGVVLFVVALAAAGWWIERQSLHLSHQPDPYNLEVLGVGPGTVTLSRSSSSAELGRYRLEWEGGSAIVSDVLAARGGRVTRQLSAPSGAPVRVGMRSRLENVYRGDPLTALGLAFQEVGVTTPLGAMPAWLIPGTSPTWAIVIHGYGADREDGLYVLPALHRAGLSAMVVSYRNDVGAARGPGGLVHFGQTEWRDIDADVAYALAHGARDVVLVGASMGGAISCEYVRHSSHAGAVRGLVLDAPALDFGSDLRFGGQSHGLSGPPGWLVMSAGQLAMRIRAGINFSDLNEIAHARDFHVPILLFQGDRDDAVPASGADAFSRARPDLVTYVRVHGAGHVRSWSVDSSRYEQALSSFLARLAERPAA
jgi:alpha-beta hydrolase superfamily lysophospholipase